MHVVMSARGLLACLCLCSSINVSTPAQFGFVSSPGAVQRMTHLPSAPPNPKLSLSAHRLGAARFGKEPFPKLGRRGPQTLRMSSTSSGSPARLVVGVNKYSHDTSVCIARKDTGEVLMIWSKERHSRRKHDGGDISGLLESALDNLGFSQDDVELVVSNNHHFRVLPYEETPQQLAWSAHLGHIPESYTSDMNLLPNARHVELSHHLAHAWSAASQAPFDDGLVVVMDGMGEAFEAMAAEHSRKDQRYFTDLKLQLETKTRGSIVPTDVEHKAAASAYGFRECETAYTFSKAARNNGGGDADNGGGGLQLSPLLKRWQAERSPTTLYNFGFENMDSPGAVYSRVSSAVFGDWNACGKVMGLAPWHSVWGGSAQGEEASELPVLMYGKLSSEEPGAWKVNWGPLQDKPFAGAKYEVDAGLEGSTEGTPTSKAAAKLAASVQKDLEAAGMDLVRDLKEQSGAKNLVLCGGVALNSVLNGRLQRELGFEQVYIPPYPGDDGIAVGCCAFGLFSDRAQGDPEGDAGGEGESQCSVWPRPLSPYMGPSYSDDDVREAIEAAAPWIEVEEVEDEGERVERTAAAVAEGKVVAWWNGRSEAGPRALGHRSLLADPRNASMVALINSVIKHREAFRPFAPSVLADEAHAWFDGIPDSEAAAAVSPYMSVTVKVKAGLEEKIPAVTHVDGTSRLQTVTAEQEPLYYRLIKAFWALTKVPMVLNTSFNTIRGEPITETPSDAIRSFLATEGAIDHLVLSRWVVRRKPSALETLDAEDLGTIVPVPAGPFQLETTEAVTDGFSAVTRVRAAMPASVRAVGEEGWFGLTDSLESAILEACDGERIIGEIVQEFVADEEVEEDVEVSDVLERLQHLYDNCLVSFVDIVELRP